jgi:predicted DNA-binding protein with PD1-like motif
MSSNDFGEKMTKGQVGKMRFFRILEDEDLIGAVKKRVEESRTRAGILILIGSLKNATLGYYSEGEYKSIQLNGPLEIASCMGNIAVDERNEIVIHAHMVVSNDEGKAFGGHLMKGCYVGATAELVILGGVDVNLRRAFDEKTKLNLWKLS